MFIKMFFKEFKGTPWYTKLLMVIALVFSLGAFIEALPVLWNAVFGN